MRERETSGQDEPGRTSVPADRRTIDRLHRAHALGKLVGDAPAFRSVIARLPAIARADATVLLNGETGTGKELVARAIHYLSERRTASFTAVNCGSLPDTLLEDEFFGTNGARSRTRGPAERTAASGGRWNALLDEVDAPPRGQVSRCACSDRTYRACLSRDNTRHPRRRGDEYRSGSRVAKGVV
jgi:transcriptional regulator with GAF, ATPase, and Fis domain